MNLKIKIPAIVLLILTLAVVSVQAQVTNLISISATAEMQGNTNDNGTVTAIAGPLRDRITTKDVLSLLAEDENAEGNYDAASFPSGAKLVVIITGPVTGGGTTDFQVLDKKGDYLTDVSDILSLTEGTNAIYYGKMNDSSGVYIPTLTEKRIISLQFYDLGINRGAGFEFFLRGMATRTVADTKPKGDVYEETRIDKFTDGEGTGTYKDIHFILTGTLELNGQAMFVVAPRDDGDPGGTFPTITTESPLPTEFPYSEGATFSSATFSQAPITGMAPAP